MASRNKRIALALSGIAIVGAGVGAAAWALRKKPAPVPPTPAPGPEPPKPVPIKAWKLLDYGTWARMLGFRYDGKRTDAPEKPSVGCYSVNKKDCTSDKAEIDKARSTLGDASPMLWCGEDHKAKWGDTGYSKPGHWCNTMP